MIKRIGLAVAAASTVLTVGTVVPAQAGVLGPTNFTVQHATAQQPSLTGNGCITVRHHRRVYTLPDFLGGGTAYGHWSKWRVVSRDANC